MAEEMRWVEFGADVEPTFTIETICRRQKEALSAEGAKQFQWLSSKMFPMLRGKSIDAAFLVVLALLDFVLKVMQDREDAGMSPQPKPVS
jgi:hypothetical protein